MDHSYTNTKSSPNRRQVNKPHTLRSREWNSAHVLLVIILLQAVFMIFMGMHGTGSQSDVNVAPHQRGKKNGWNAKNGGGGRKNKNRKALQGETHHHNSHKDTENKVPIEEAPPVKSEPKKPPVTKPPKATSPPQYKEMVQVKEWEVSTEDFPGALHLHFAHERQDPSFRGKLKLNPNKWSQAEEEATRKLVKKKQTIHSCHYYHKNDADGSMSLRLKDSCLNPDNTNGAKQHNGLVAYNTQSFPRIWCGKTIEPGSIQHFHKSEVCNETARILLESDKMLGVERTNLKHLPPVVFRRRNSDNANIESVQDCNVPCKFTMDTCQDAETGKKQKGPACLSDVSDWVVDGTDFQFKYSMLDPRDAPEINIMRKGYREHQFYATRSFSSEIPLSTFVWDKYGTSTHKNDFKKGGQHGICFIHVEPCTGEIRPGVWAGKVQEAFKGNFEAYGPCKFPKMTMKDTKLNVYNYKDRQKIMSDYMFTLVIGQSQTPDFVQDMVWDALQAGSIPVYFGAPNIRDHVPPNSIIVGAEFSSQADLAEYLEKVMADRSKWRNYHTWRDEDTEHFEAKYGFLKESSSSPYCRMCQWALATKYGLGWNPVTQSIQRPAVDRTLCMNPKDEVKFPFLELWMSNLGVQEPKGRKLCDKSSAMQTMAFDDISLTRTVSTHDNGVIDMVISDIRSLRDKDKIVLRMDFHNAIHNVEGAHILHPHQLMATGKDASDHVPLMSSIVIQDKKTRVTVLTNWATDLKTPTLESIIDVLILDLRKAKDVGKEDPVTGYRTRLAKDDARRIRIIMEDVNLLRDVSTEYSISPYASLMMKDFLDPLLHLYVD